MSTQKVKSKIVCWRVVQGGWGLKVGPIEVGLSRGAKYKWQFFVMAYPKPKRKSKLEVLSE